MTTFSMLRDGDCWIHNTIGARVLCWPHSRSNSLRDYWRDRIVMPNDRRVVTVKRERWAVIDDMAFNKWIKALRSGEYRQGVGRLALRKDGQTSYCCLGVACVVLGIPGEPQSNRSLLFDHNEFDLPPSAMTWLGMKTKVGHIMHPWMTQKDDGEGYKSLAWLNDGYDGLTFDQIADTAEFFKDFL